MKISKKLKKQLFVLFKEERREWIGKLISQGMKKSQARGKRVGGFGSVSEKTENQIKTYIRQGVSSHKIQDLLQCGGNTVQRVARELGVPPGLTYKDYAKKGR
jgi:DNA invertase Pin-like site-specific DNA recombinase